MNPTVFHPGFMKKIKSQNFQENEWTWKAYC